MLRPKKKITKREFKQDALVTTYAEVTSFYETHKRNISIAITALVILIVAAVVFLKNRSDNNEKAATLVGSIFSYYDSGQFQVAIDGIPERNVQGLRSIVENYGASAAGQIATFYLANSYFQLGNYEEALKYFDDCSVSDELLATSRLSGIAACNEAKGDYREAAGYFERAAAKNTKGVNAAEFLNDAARNYALAGEKEKALDLYRRLKKNYPATPFGRDADRYIAQLTV